MPSLKAVTEKTTHTTPEADKNLEGGVEEDAPEELISDDQSFLRDNLNDIVLLIVLIGLTVIKFATEDKLMSLNLFFIVILVTGYTLGKRVAVLTAFLTILIVWAFILSDKTPFLIHYSNDILNFYMTLWSGFLILTGWLGSALAKTFQRETEETEEPSPSLTKKYYKNLKLNG
jgi:K+-sensing histidine kinase KdpD